MTAPARGMYFEEFEEGLEIHTGAHTITETDIVNFAGLSGDFNFIHTNTHAVQETPFGQRVAHGMLVASIATGLAVQQGFIDGTTLAFRDLGIPEKIILPKYFYICPDLKHKIAIWGNA